MAEAGPIPVVKTAEAIHRVQFILIDSNSCSARQHVASSSLLSRPDYEDVVIERSIAGVCGYPTCSNPLPPQRGHRARYRVSLRDHRVYELEETFKYCSEECLISSRTFSALLSEERVLEMVEAKVQHVLRLFEHGNDGNEGSVGEGDLVSSGLSIKEKELTGSREVSLWELVGTESAIEGYVPLRDRVGDSGPNLLPQQISGKQKEGTGNSLTQYAGSLAEYDVEIHPKTSSGANQQLSAMMREQLEEITISEKARGKESFIKDI
ncbi:hypothetical protein HPP92_021933 [Vanilla planifolia]|uniref:RNA polymerase II subunit B1 CTD phosphatase RPAP2 homolog n=1 Tax=Vanilla planifolia TaxID=51239 RepID=A0A835UJG4_VANPL|nr:hypothetical protein HPP92_021933 [Vanilla planifolia]